MLKRIAFDAAVGDDGVLARLKLVGELARIKVGLKDAGDGPAAAVKRLKLVARANQLRVELGASARMESASQEEPTPAGQVSATPDDGSDGLSDDPNSPNYRYRDTGYIAASRKEKAASMIFSAKKNGLRLRASDIDFDAIEQNPRQAKDIIVKANLFGKTDWQALQEGGMEPAAGFLIDKIYASIAPEPSQDNPSARRDYAIGLESIRDRLQGVKAVAEVLDVLSEIRDELDGTTLKPDEAEQYELLTEQARELSDQVRTLDGSSNAIYKEAQDARNPVARAIKEAGSAEAAVLALDSYFAGKNYSPKNVKAWRKIAVAFYAKEGETSAELKTGALVSSFAKEAQVLDSGSFGKYWSRSEEMAARAFQAWIEDKLAGMDRRNDYLSIYADNKFHVDPLFGIEWKPYPEGEERARINAAFDRLFEAIRNGKVFEKAAANGALLDSIFGSGLAGASP